MLQKVIVPFKIQCSYLSIVTDDNYRTSGKSAYMEQAKCKPQIHTPLFPLPIV